MLRVPWRRVDALDGSLNAASSHSGSVQGALRDQRAPRPFPPAAALLPSSACFSSGLQGRWYAQVHCSTTGNMHREMNRGGLKPAMQADGEERGGLQGQMREGERWVAGHSGAAGTRNRQQHNDNTSKNGELGN